MIPNPIHRVLSTIQTNDLRCLLMGGQACVLYGAAEFSRDVDIAVLLDPTNMERLQAVVADLDAVNIAVPPFEGRFLERGHAVHFRCQLEDARGIRLDVMARMRGVDSFSQLWERRTTLEAGTGERYELLSLPDLVKAKKTQRDKDWPMIRSLVTTSFAIQSADPTLDLVRFWLMELRDPELLIRACAAFTSQAIFLTETRPLLAASLCGDVKAVQMALVEEEGIERELDRQYWEPLRRELEELRLKRKLSNLQPFIRPEG